MTSRKVGILLFPNSYLLDFAGPAQVLDTVNLFRPGAIDVHFIAPAPDIDTHQGIRLTALSPLPQDGTVYDLLLVCGGKFHPAMVDTKAAQTGIRWLQEYAERAPQAAIAAVCTGAFFLARAGLLKERRCTTHHSFLKHLKEEEPTANVGNNYLFIKHDNIITSANTTAGTDMVLDWIGELFGAEFNARVARELAIYGRRNFEYDRISDYQAYRNHVDQPIHKLQDDMAADPAREWTPEDLEQHVGISHRQLIRRFRVATGGSIKQYQLFLRLEMAYKLLQEKYYTIQQLSEAVGIQSPHAFRKAWIMRYGKSPSVYRPAEI